MANLNNTESLNAFLKLVKYLTLLIAISIFLIICLVVVMHFPLAATGNNAVNETSPLPPGDGLKKASAFILSDDFEIPGFDDSKEGKAAAYGHKLITETYALIGPGSENPVTGNRLACSNCHLNAGTKPFAAPYVGLSGIFPVYIGREDKIESLEERINGCFERSMNGKAIDVNDEIMRGSCV